MILTFTPNPSIDRTCSVPRPLTRGGVYRLTGADDVAGGKGVNVSAAVERAGRSTLALFPVAKSGRFCRLVRAAGVPYEPVDVDDEARVNLTIVEADGTTTKLNNPGSELHPDDAARCLDRLTAHAPAADWVVLAGSLPRGVDPRFYLAAIAAVRAANPAARIAVDTSDAPLAAIGAALRAGEPGPDLLKPNGVELGQLAGLDGADLEARAEAGDFTGIVEAARAVGARGVPELLITLGSAGAVLALAGGPVLHATSPRIIPQSTVGAGDSALAGYLLGHAAGDAPAERLRRAVAYGAAATSLPGTTAPRPGQVHPDQSRVTILADAPVEGNLP